MNAIWGVLSGLRVSAAVGCLADASAAVRPPFNPWPSARVPLASLGSGERTAARARCVATVHRHQEPRMNLTDALTALGTLALVALLHPVPEIAFALQGGAVGAFVGMAVGFHRGRDSEGRAELIYRWTALGIGGACLLLAGDWVLV